MRSHGLEPVEPYPGSARKWRCIHVACGREVTPTYSDVRQGRTSGCRGCSIRPQPTAKSSKPTKTRGPTRTHSRSTVDPAEAADFMASRGYEPLEPYPGRDKPWRCRHAQCGREVTPRYGNIKAGWGAAQLAPGAGRAIRSRPTDEGSGPCTPGGLPRQQQALALHSPRVRASCGGEVRKRSKRWRRLCPLRWEGSHRPGRGRRSDAIGWP